MQLTRHESRLVLAALRTLERNLAGELQPLTACRNLLIHPSHDAFHHHQRVLNLSARLSEELPGNTCHQLNTCAAEVVVRGLTRYAELLADCTAEAEVINDDLPSPEQRCRERELKETARLLLRLKALRPTRRSLRAVS